MVQNEVMIDEELCHGCGYCVQFCPRGCLDIPGEQPGPMYSGYEIARCIHPEQCNACGICTRMCPCGAVEVYLSVMDPATNLLTRERVAGIPRLLPSAGLGDCVGCQKATVGRMITEVLMEMGLEGKFMGLDAIRCNSSSAFGSDFDIVVEREGKRVPLHGARPSGISPVEVHDDPMGIAIELKRRHPEKVVFVVQDTPKLDAIGIDAFDQGLTRGDGLGRGERRQQQGKENGAQGSFHGRRLLIHDKAGGFPCQPGRRTAVLTVTRLPSEEISTAPSRSVRYTVAPAPA